MFSVFQCEIQKRYSKYFPNHIFFYFYFFLNRIAHTGASIWWKNYFFWITQLIVIQKTIRFFSKKHKIFSKHFFFEFFFCFLDQVYIKYYVLMKKISFCTSQQKVLQKTVFLEKRFDLTIQIFFIVRYHQLTSCLYVHGLSYKFTNIYERFELDLWSQKNYKIKNFSHYRYRPVTIFQSP